MRKGIKREVKEHSIFATFDTMVSLNNWTKLIDVMKKVSGTDIVENDDYVYFKVYYTEGMSVEDKNEIFVSISSLPCDKKHEFLGVTEYNDNKEMCFVFRKNR